MDAVMVGYWAERPGEGALPFPVAGARPWARQAAFVAALRAIEAGIREGRFGTRTAYRGLSMCRLCRRPNGHEEFEHAGFRWPSGLMHYVVEHNVRLPAAFVDHVLEAAR